MQIYLCTLCQTISPSRWAALAFNEIVFPMGYLRSGSIPPSPLNERFKSDYSKEIASKSATFISLYIIIYSIIALIVYLLFCLFLIAIRRT